MTKVELTLDSSYLPRLWDVRKQVSADRRAGVPITFVSLRAQVTSPTIEVAIESGSLYLVGVRKAGDDWYEFADDRGLRSSALLGNAAPRLPGSRPIRVGGDFALATYRALRLPDMIGRSNAGGGAAFYGRAEKLLAFFGVWDGKLNANPERLAICVLIFAVCEALRFRSIENACESWIRGRGPDGPAERFVITAAMLEKVQNWKAAQVDDGDVWTWLPGVADPIIS